MNIVFNQTEELNIARPKTSPKPSPYDCRLGSPDRNLDHQNHLEPPSLRICHAQRESPTTTSRTHKPICVSLSPINPHWVGFLRAKGSHCVLPTHKGTKHFSSIQAVRIRVRPSFLLLNSPFALHIYKFSLFITSNTIRRLPTLILTVNVPTNKKKRVLLGALLLWFYFYPLLMIGFSICFLVLGSFAFDPNRLPKRNRFLGIQDFTLLLHNYR